MRRWFVRRARDERGAVLVIAAAIMVAVLAMAAFAIDVGSWYQVERQAQGAADAAALAGARDLPASQATATSDAKTYVGYNMQGDTPTIAVTFPTSTEIKVTVTQVAPSFFGKTLGINSATVTESAVAQETGGATTCSTPGNGCDAVFAMATSCAGAPVVFGGGTHITGGVVSNGSINVGGGGSSFGPTTYGNGSGCTVSPSGYAGQNNTFASGPTSQAPVTSWPINYATDFPPCTGTACTGPGGTPSFCTQSTTAASETLQNYYPVNLTSGNIYCDVGTGTSGTPTTWNGAITVNMGKGTVEATFAAGSVTMGGGDSLTACGYAAAGYLVSGCSASVPVPVTGNYPLVYALGTGTSISNGGGGGTFLGDMFAPNGTIYMGGGDATTFLEGQGVQVPSGGFTGDGPSSSGGGGGSGSTALIQ